MALLILSLAFVMVCLAGRPGPPACAHVPARTCRGALPHPPVSSHTYMKKHLLFLSLLCGVLSSAGDQLPEFADCRKECELVLCPQDPNVRATSPSGGSFGSISAKVDAIDDLIELYSKNSINPVSEIIFNWDCALDCNYKCQQIVHSRRKHAGLPTVKFYGKWPFWRVAGVTEFCSVLFSVANFYVCYSNFRKMATYYAANKAQAAGNDPQSASRSVMAWQYCILLSTLMLGWLFSTVFHIRDTKISETMDYLGAGLIVVANFNAIAVRYFNLHEKRLTRRVFQALMLAMLLGHYSRLYRHWDYDYNMRFSIFMGICSVVLWFLHSLHMNRVFRDSARVYSDPYERRIVKKLLFMGFRASLVPFIPILLNLYLLCAIYFEVNDFEPWLGLLDAHSVWHICTILPPLIWYDWNIWDLELSSRSFK